MAELNYRKKSKLNAPKIIMALVIIGMFASYHLYFKKQWFGKKDEKTNSTSYSSSQAEKIFEKNENELSYDEWKKIVDYRAQQYLECCKDVDYSTGLSVGQMCSGEYSNNWVLYRNGLDHNANLPPQQIDELKDYWNSVQDKAIKKSQDMMDANDKKKRPNYYNK